MLPASELQEIIEAYQEQAEVGDDIDCEMLAKFITSKSYALLRAQRPNLGVLLVAACTVLEFTVRKHDLGITVDNRGNVEVIHGSTDASATGNTMIEALIHFADGLEP